MRDACIVGQATLDDLDALTPLFDGYRVFYERPSDFDTAREFLRERLALRESVIFIARNEQGEALGFTQLYPCFSSVSARRLWILNDLFVAESAGGRGVARALMDAAHKYARQTGAIRLVLQTARDNARAQALYESLGYVRDEGMYEYSLEL
ncbi:MAG TPA: GNAT family N-acetyltransferase [Rhodanobacteraceae bacterium]|nr:GNAT family N-acetyltransferase [Rhodanobacteraceae bacterium]